MCGMMSSCKNFQSSQVYPVEPGRFYRSGQLTTEALKKAIEDNKIKTVINLRGAKPKEKWFEEEFDLLERLQVSFISLGFDKDSIPHRRNLLALIDIFREVEYPVLIHCDDGINRTGEVSALYQMVQLRKTKDEALEMLSSDYGYTGSVAERSKKYFINHVWQDENWAFHVYEPCTQPYEYYDQENVECGTKK